MQINLPETRAYYLASKNEPGYLLCWIPAEELAQLVHDGRVARDILDDHPGGLELEVSAAAFDDVELELGVSPAAIKSAFEALRERQAQGDDRALPESGIVAGAWLEQKARQAEHGPIGFAAGAGPFELAADETPPEPRMSDGLDARTMMQSL